MLVLNRVTMIMCSRNIIHRQASDPDWWYTAAELLDENHEKLQQQGTVRRTEDGFENKWPHYLIANLRVYDGHLVQIQSSTRFVSETSFRTNSTVRTTLARVRLD